MRMRIPLVAVLALFVAVSCDQKLVEPAADQVAEAPAFNFMNGPRILATPRYTGSRNTDLTQSSISSGVSEPGCTTRSTRGGVAVLPTILSGTTRTWMGIVCSL